MRDDMAKVIVERPRVPAFKSRKGRRQALDDLPLREGFRRAASLRGDRKQLNENLASSARSAARGIRCIRRSRLGSGPIAPFSSMCATICGILSP